MRDRTEISLHGHRMGIRGGDRDHGLVTGSPQDAHPLLQALLAAADGRFPAVDGEVTFTPHLPGGLEAVVSFTGHAYLATTLPGQAFADLALDGYGSALSPTVLLRLAGPQGQIGMLDVTVVARGTGAGSLPVRADLEGHSRVRHARTLRRHVRVHGDQRGLVTVAQGLAGRTEISVEVFPGHQGRGTRRALIQEALGLVPCGELLFAAVSPGNARSLRAFLDTGFQPLGSEVLIVPGRRDPNGDSR